VSRGSLVLKIAVVMLVVGTAIVLRLAWEIVEQPRLTQALSISPVAQRTTTYDRTTGPPSPPPPPPPPSPNPSPPSPPEQLSQLQGFVAHSVVEQKGDGVFIQPFAETCT
jgi:hypothetical protein